MKEIEERARRQGFGRHHASTIHLDLGDEDAAFACAEIAVAERAAGFELLASMPAFERLGSHPRWRGLLAKYGVKSVCGATAGDDHGRGWRGDILRSGAAGS